MNDFFKEKADEYLNRMLGDRKGCDILCGLPEELQDEIIDELADFIEDVSKMYLDKMTGMERYGG